MNLPEFEKEQKIVILLIVFLTASTLIILQNEKPIFSSEEKSGSQEYLNIDTDQINQSNVIIETPPTQFTGKSKQINILQKNGSNSIPIKNVKVTVNKSKPMITDEKGSVNYNFSKEGKYTIKAELKNTSVSVLYNAVDSNALRLDFKLTNTPIESGRNLRFAVNKPATVYYEDGRNISVNSSYYGPQTQKQSSSNISIPSDNVNSPVEVTAPKEPGEYKITAENGAQEVTKTLRIIEELEDFKLSINKTDGRNITVAAVDYDGNYIGGVEFTLLTANPAEGDLPDDTQSLKFELSKDEVPREVKLPEPADEWYVLGKKGYISEIERVDLSG